MDETQYANGITAKDLRAFLEFWPRFSAMVNEAPQVFIEKEEKLLAQDTERFSWCHFYELPFEQHIALLSAGFIQDEQVAEWYKQVIDSPSQIGALPGAVEQIEKHFGALEAPSEEEVEEARPALAAFTGIWLSVSHSLRCVLYHGRFLNELIERVRADDDKALFDAVRIDPTVVGCKPVIERISKAMLLKDNRFFAKLKAAINGKMAKREQANFQKMRLVFEILHEAGAARLSDEQLRQLFVDDLNLYDGNTKGGGNKKSLRKLTDTYMKENTTT